MESTAQRVCPGGAWVMLHPPVHLPPSCMISHHTRGLSFSTCSSRCACTGRHPWSALWGSHGCESQKEHCWGLVGCRVPRGTGWFQRKHWHSASASQPDSAPMTLRTVVNTIGSWTLGECMFNRGRNAMSSIVLHIESLWLFYGRKCFCGLFCHVYCDIICTIL